MFNTLMTALLSKGIPKSPGALLSVALLSLGVAGCREGSTQVDTPDVHAIVDGNTAFALDLYRTLKEQPGNLFFSPHSISTALSMTLAGARGDTEKQMAATLHLNPPPERLHPAYGSLEAWLLKTGARNHLTLTTANSLWHQRDYPFTEAYVQLLRGSYQAEAFAVDFAGADDPAGQINRWVAGKTSNLIQDAGLNQLDPATRLVLCNAIYFKGNWETQFDPEDTRPGPFHLSSELSVEVPMMHGKPKCRAVDWEDVRELDLPYKGGQMSMIILMPAKPDGLPELESRLNETNLRIWLMNLNVYRPRETEVVLPRFKTSRTLDLRPTLAGLGMASAFDPSTADFSGMDGSRQLFLSRVVHQAVVEVDEEGTRAAAATHSAVEASAVMEAFVVDRPFLFLIRENHTGSILFLGRMLDPTK